MTLLLVTLIIVMFILTLLETLLKVTLLMALSKVTLLMTLLLVTLLMSLYNLSIIAVADPESSAGARSMKYKPPRSVAIVFMTIFTGPAEGT